jgi:hypothetical protein
MIKFNIFHYGMFLGLWGLIKFNIFHCGLDKIQHKVELLGLWRFQGHYRLDKFQIQPEPDISQQE